MLSMKIDVPRGMSREMKKMVNSWVNQCQSRVANKVTENVKTIFALEGARGGNPKWEPTSKIAIKFRQVDKNAPTLVDSGKLRDSIYATVHKDPKAIFVVIGSDLRYLYEHNDGPHFYTPPPERDNPRNLTFEVPQRKILFLTSDDRNIALNVFRNTAIGAKFT